MHVLIVYCHPEPDSFNGWLRDKAIETFETAGHHVEVSDLYAEKFDPVEKPEHYRNRIVTDRFEPLAEQRHAYKTNTLPEDVKREIERLKRCDLLILQFPLWWHQQPAMLKGWFDRVFVSGGLYTSKMRYDRGYFKGKRAICCVTSGAPLETFTKNGRGGGDIDTLLHSMNFSLYYMGFSVLPPCLFAEVQGAGFTYKSTEAFQRHLQSHLHNWEKHLRRIDRIEPLDYPGWNEWDERGVEKKS
jgi:NAD(P)H dehydrogenase (quinone)